MLKSAGKADKEKQNQGEQATLTYTLTFKKIESHSVPYSELEKNNLKVLWINMTCRFSFHISENAYMTKNLRIIILPE